MLGTFSSSEYFAEYKFRVIHNVEKASVHNCAQRIEYFRLHIEYLWNTVDLKKDSALLFEFFLLLKPESTCGGTPETLRS